MFKPKMTVDSVDAACQLALAGAGYTSPPDFLVDKHIKQGELVEILPDWTMQPLKVYALWLNVPKSSLVLNFKDYLIEQLSSLSLVS